jgi:predicted dehydrogenase
VLAGAGRWGRVHAHRLAERGDVALAAVWDHQPDRAEQLARDLPAGAAPAPRVVRNEDELPGDLDAAVVAVSSPAHVAVASALLRRGIPVLLEKPLACDDEGLDRLVQASADAALVPAMVERFNPAFRAAVAQVDRPLFLQAERLAPFDRLLPGTSGSPTDVILDLMIHDLDLVHALVADSVVEVRAVGAPVIGPHADMAHARLEFDGGAVAVLAASRASPRPVRTLRVFGPQGYWSLDLLQRSAHRCMRSGEPPGLDLAPLAVATDEDALVAQHTSFLEGVRRGERDEGGLARTVEAHRVAFQVERAIEGGLQRWLGS